MRRSEARLKLLLDTTPAVIFTSRAEGDYRTSFISDSSRFVLGYEPECFTEAPQFWASHIHPEDAPQIFTDLPRIVLHGWRQHEYRFLHGDGSYRWIESGMSLVDLGIDEADIPRLFRPFEQLDSRLSRQYDGTGLGLSLVLRLNQLHGGGVTVVSTPGQGSRFTVTLPWRQQHIR